MPSFEKGIRAVSVAGFKSVTELQRIEIGQLTVLCGENSSGKSSMMQPLLLLKQTLEATYDPGALLMYGPIVKFTSTDQILSRKPRGKTTHFEICIEVSAVSVKVRFKKEPKGISIEDLVFHDRDKVHTVRIGMSSEEIDSIIDPHFKASFNQYLETVPAKGGRKLTWGVVRNRCFLEPTIVYEGSQEPFFQSVTAAPTQYVGS